MTDVINIQTEITHCSVCYEIAPIILQCKHCVCTQCITSHFKPECPLCRKPHSFEVSGSPPKDNISLNIKDLKIKDKPKTLAQIYNEMREKQRNQEQIQSDEISSSDIDEEDSDCVDYDL